MSSDGYFTDDDLDASAFAQLDAIEAAHLSPTKPPAAPTSREPLTQSSSFYDLTLDGLDEDEFERLDNFIEDAYQGKAQPVAGPSRTSSRASLQTTLFGEVLRSEAPSGISRTQSRPQLQKTKSTPRNPFGHQAPKTKQWDQTAFAKSGLKRGKSKGKGKGKASHDDDEEEEEQVEFEQFPAPFVSGIPLSFLFSTVSNLCTLVG